MQESASRVFLLDREIVTALAHYGLEDVNAEDRANEVLRSEMLGAIPDALSPVEVEDIAIQIDTAAEFLAPSWSGVENGRKAQVGALQYLAARAIFTDDMVSYQNIRRHMRTELGLPGRASSMALALGKRSHQRRARRLGLL